MFGSSILDIAIGVAFVFLVLSVFATTINNLILSLFNMRGKDLLLAMQTGLDHKSALGLVQNVYTQFQVFGLIRGKFNPNNRGNLPFNIPSENFAIALLDSTSQPFSEFTPGVDPIQPLVTITHALNVSVFGSTRKDAYE